MVADLDVVDGAGDDHDGRDEVAADGHALALVVEIGDVDWLGLVEFEIRKIRLKYGASTKKS